MTREAYTWTTIVTLKRGSYIFFFDLLGTKHLRVKGYVFDLCP